MHIRQVDRAGIRRYAARMAATASLFDDLPIHRRKPSADYLLKRRVRNRTLYAVRRGILRRGRCAECGASNVHAHHLRYDLPHAHLLVHWLCPLHHMREHTKKPEAQYEQIEMWSGD